MLDAASSGHFLVAWLSGGAAAVIPPHLPRGVKRRLESPSAGASRDSESSVSLPAPKRQASPASDIDGAWHRIADLIESASWTASLAWSIDELVLCAATSRGLDAEDPSVEVGAATSI